MLLLFLFEGLNIASFISLYLYVPDEGSLLPKYGDCTTHNDFELYLMCCGVMLLLLIIYKYIHSNVPSQVQAYPHIHMHRGEIKHIHTYVHTYTYIDTWTYNRNIISFLAW